MRGRRTGPAEQPWATDSSYGREDGRYTVQETADGIDLRTLATQLGSDNSFGGPDRHNLWAKMTIEALRWDDLGELVDDPG